MTPRFPPAGPDGHGSPPSQVLSRRYDFLLRLAFGLLIRPPAPRVPAGFVSVQNAPVGAQARRQAGGLIVRAGHPRSSGLAHGQEQDLPGSLAIHPVTLRRSTTPDDPSRLTDSGTSGAAPTRLTVKASSITDFEASSAASSPTVYASRRPLPCAMQDSFPAGGLRLCRAGVEPAGSR